MKEKKDTQKLEQPQLPSWKDENEYLVWLHEQKKDAVKAVAEMSKHPLSLEEARANYDQLHGKNYWGSKKES